MWTHFCIHRCGYGWTRLDTMDTVGGPETMDAMDVLDALDAVDAGETVDTGDAPDAPDAPGKLCRIFPGAFMALFPESPDGDLGCFRGFSGTFPESPDDFQLHLI